MTDFMQRIAKPQVDPRQIPEHRLWTLTKDGRRAEARTRMVPIGAGRPGAALLRLKNDGREVGELSNKKRQEFEARSCLINTEAA